MPNNFFGIQWKYRTGVPLSGIPPAGLHWSSTICPGHSFRNSAPRMLFKTSTLFFSSRGRVFSSQKFFGKWPMLGLIPSFHPPFHSSRSPQFWPCSRRDGISQKENCFLVNLWVDGNELWNLLLNQWGQSSSVSDDCRLLQIDLTNPGAQPPAATPH